MGEEVKLRPITMSYINKIKSWFGIGNVTANKFENASDALVTEFSEIKQDANVEERINAPIAFVDRLTEDGAFHTYSTAKISFDLGKHGNYPVEVALPRRPDEESEIERFMDRLGYDVQDLPQLEEGDFTVPFAKIEGEWKIDWDEIEEVEEIKYSEEDNEANEVEN